MSLSQFFNTLVQYPVLWVVVILIMGVILVNGWTDAPNAIAGCVVTRAISPRAAILMAAVFNFLGVFIMTMISRDVIDTIGKMVTFDSTNKNAALIALCAAMVSIVTWAVLAWVFGIPTSESHALIAGLTGSALALGGIEGVNGAEWLKVVYGIGVSLLLGFGLSYLLTKLIQKCCKNADYRKSSKWFGRGQVVAAAGTAFMHGAQDGQKFMSIFMLGIALSTGGSVEASTIPIWLMILCSLVMGIGTSIGGMKIIKSVGMDMVRIEKYQGFAADLATTTGLLVCSFAGMPVSTTHAKTTSMMGAGAAKSFKKVNWNVAKEMVYTWILTFPGCGLLGFLMTKLFSVIF